MITEDYVSFETAKLLKEKGFDIPTERFYNEHISWRAASAYNWNDEGGEDCSCPTLQMAIKWLREEYNLAIAIYLKTDGWHSGVSQIKFNGEGFIVDIIDGIDDGNIPNCDTYEEAAEAAIKYCLENKLIF